MKKTSEIIASRVITEAKALLKHSNADFTEIAYMLGFEYPNNFVTFFKRRSKDTPKSFRNNENIPASNPKIFESHTFSFDLQMSLDE